MDHLEKLGLLQFFFFSFKHLRVTFKENNTFLLFLMPFLILVHSVSAVFISFHISLVFYFLYYSFAHLQQSVIVHLVKSMLISNLNPKH